MKANSGLSRIIIPSLALIIGLGIGLAASHVKLTKERKLSVRRMEEANRKVTSIWRKMTAEKNDAVAAMEQQCQEELDEFRKEKSGIEGRVGGLEEQALKLQTRLMEAEDALVGERKAAAEADARKKSEIGKMESKNKELAVALNKSTGEIRTLRAKLKKTNEEFGRCAANNAELCVIAEELVEKYRDKGLDEVFLHKEPLTQIGKVKLEHFIQEYRAEIEGLKIKKNASGAGHAAR